jgi:hypothetical protein
MRFRTSLWIRGDRTDLLPAASLTVGVQSAASQPAASLTVGVQSAASQPAASLTVGVQSAASQAAASLTVGVQRRECAYRLVVFVRTPKSQPS